MVQNDLFLIEAELATPTGTAVKPEYRVSERHVTRLEETIKDLTKDISAPETFIVPGLTFESAALDFCRTLVRRAERITHKMHKRKVLKGFNLIRYEQALKSSQRSSQIYRVQAVWKIRPFQVDKGRITQILIIRLIYPFQISTECRIRLGNCKVLVDFSSLR